MSTQYLPGLPSVPLMPRKGLSRGESRNMAPTELGGLLWSKEPWGKRLAKTKGMFYNSGETVENIVLELTQVNFVMGTEAVSKRRYWRLFFNY